MNKLLKNLGIIIITTPLFIKPALALELSPETINVAKGKEIELDLLATTDTKMTGVEIRLDVYGGEVISFTPSTGNLAIGTCDKKQAMTDKDSICVDIVNAEGIFDGDTLGKINIKLTTNKLNIVTAGNNGYTVSNTGLTYINQGLVGSYGKNAENIEKIGTTNNVEPKNQTQEEREGMLENDVVIEESNNIDYSLTATVVFALGGLLFLAIMYLRKRKSKNDVKIVI